MQEFLYTCMPSCDTLLCLHIFSMHSAASVWRTVNELAARPGMINMGQGFPDFAGSAVARAAAREALEDPASNQYSPQPGYESLREEIAAFIGRRYGDDDCPFSPDLAFQRCSLTVSSTHNRTCMTPVECRRIHRALVRNRRLRQWTGSPKRLTPCACGSRRRSCRVRTLLPVSAWGDRAGWSYASSCCAPRARLCNQ